MARKKVSEENIKMEEKIFEPYDVEVEITNLNLRKGPGKKYAKADRFCKPGLQTITEEKNGYGKRPDGLWIALEFCKRV